MSLEMNRLVGITTYTKQLLRSIEDVASGQSVVCEISGLSGTGKTSIVKSHYTQFRQLGPVFSCKFTQIPPSNPYQIVNEGLDQMIGEMLASRSPSFNEVAQNIRGEMGDLAKVLAPDIQGLAALIGDEHAIPLAPERAKNRLFNAYSSLFRALRVNQASAVFLIDDLQWITKESATILTSLIEEHCQSGSLFIFIYRSDEYQRNQDALRLISESPKQKNAHSVKLEIGALTPECTGEVLSQLLGGKCPGLVDYIYAKTAGNPFYIKEFVTHARYLDIITVNEGVVSFDRPALERLKYAKSIEHLAKHTINSLGDNASKLLKLSALIPEGINSAYLHELFGAIYPRDKVDQKIIETIISQCIFAGILEPVRVEADRYRFTHDAMQYAAAQLNEDPDAMHLMIGKSLTNKHSHEPDSEILKAAYHFAQLKDFPNNPPDQRKLFSVFLRASEIAKYASAYIQCLEYATFAMHYAKALQKLDEENLLIRTMLAEAYWLCGDTRRASEFAAIVIAKSQNPLTLAKACNIQIKLVTAAGRPKEALEIWLENLGRIDSSNIPNGSIIWQLYYLVKTMRLPFHLATVHSTTEAVSELDYAIEELLISGAIAAYWAGQEYIPGIVYYGAKKTIATHSKNTPFLLSAAGVLLTGAGALKLSRIVSKKSLELLVPETESVRAKTLSTVYATSYHTYGHLADTIPALYEAHTRGLNTADYEFAAVAGLQYVYHAFFAGLPLETLEESTKKILATVKTLKHNIVENNINIYLQAIMIICGVSPANTTLVGPAFNVSASWPSLVESREFTTLANLAFSELVLSTHYSNWNLAVENIRKFMQFSPYVRGTIVIPIAHFHAAIALVMHSKSQRRWKRFKLLLAARKHLFLLKPYADNAPMNYGHKYKAAISIFNLTKGRGKNASTLLQNLSDASVAASNSGFINDAAMLTELAYVLTKQYGKRQDSTLFLKQSITYYRKWGARTKMRELRKYHDETI